jgi:hypothetical protein
MPAYMTRLLWLLNSLEGIAVIYGMRPRPQSTVYGKIVLMFQTTN